MLAHPLTVQLRNLQTLVEVAVDKNSTVSSRHRRGARSESSARS